jgi:hypothetical protein
MADVRHCRHCWGNCPGDCLMEDMGMCIHDPNSPFRGTRGIRARRLLSRRWWRRVLSGRN